MSRFTSSSEPTSDAVLFILVCTAHVRQDDDLAIWQVIHFSQKRQGRGLRGRGRREEVGVGLGADDLLGPPAAGRIHLQERG